VRSPVSGFGCISRETGVLLSSPLADRLPDSPIHLKPVLGPIQLVFYSIGIIIGAGIYSVIGAAAGMAQEALWVSFLLAAAVALLTGLSYAEMTTTFPKAGAEFLYLRRAVPEARWAAFGVGVLVLIGGSATAATVAVAFGGYLRVLVDVPVWLAALALLVACTAFNLWGLREASWVNIVFTLVEVSGLVLVIIAGFVGGDMLTSLEVVPTAAVFPAAATVFFVYLGFEGIANLTEEVRDPGRDLPKAILSSIGITTALYVLVALAAVALASPSELATSEAPLAFAIQKVWPGATTLLSAIAIFSTANTVLIAMIAASRLAFSMAREGEIPHIFSALLSSRDTPWAAAVLILALSMTLATLGGLKILAELSSFAALLAFAAVNVALIVARFRLPQLARPFRVPLSFGRMPLPPLAAILSILVLLASFDWRIYVIGIALLSVSGGGYVLRRHLNPSPPQSRAGQDGL